MKKFLLLSTILACTPGQAISGGSNVPITNETDCDSKTLVLECECPEPVINITCPEPVIENIIYTQCETPVVENIIEAECPSLECPTLECPEVTCPSPVVNNNISNTIDTQPIADELAAMTIAMEGGEWAVVAITVTNGLWEYWTNNDTRTLLVKSIHGVAGSSSMGAHIEYPTTYTTYQSYRGIKWAYGNWDGYNQIRQNIDFPIESGQTVKVVCNDECIIVGQYLNQ
jgi:hypothetical protein